jgi:hypothetical protein
MHASQHEWLLLSLLPLMLRARTGMHEPACLLLRRQLRACVRAWLRA